MTFPRLPGMVLGVLLVAGCSTATPGIPTVPAGTSAVPPSAVPPSVGAPDTSDTCTIVVGSGSVSSRGGSSRVSTVNGVTTLTCGSGPAITLAEIGPDGVGVQVAGGPATTVRPGAATAVGPYTVAVDGVAGGKATMRVTPPR